MKAYIRYGSIALMIASLILRGGLAALIFLLLFYQKELKQLYLKHKADTSGSLE